MDTDIVNVLTGERFAGVTLQQMKNEIDLGEVVVKDGNTAAERAAVWLIQQFFWSHDTVKQGTTSTKALQRALDDAKYLAINYVTNEWIDLGERAKIFLLRDAQQTGWFSDKAYNYKDLKGLLSSMLDEQTTSTGVSVYSFLIEQLLPAAERYNISPNLLFGAKNQVKKLRELIPVARDILEDETLSDNAKEQYLKHFIEKAADTAVKHPMYKKEADEYRGKNAPKIEQLKGYECIMPNGETWVVVRCPKSLDEKVVEMLLGTKVDLRVTDWSAFTVLIAQMLKSYGDLSDADKDNLIPRLIKILEGRVHGGRKIEGTEAPDLT